MNVKLNLAYMNRIQCRLESKAPLALTHCTTGSTNIVAIIDTGVELEDAPFAWRAGRDPT